jgi:hypothetical protein
MEAIEAVVYQDKYDDSVFGIHNFGIFICDSARVGHCGL